MKAMVELNFTQNRYEIRPNYTLAAEYLINWMPKLNTDYELNNMALTKEKTPVSPDVISFGSTDIITSSR